MIDLTKATTEQLEAQKAEAVSAFDKLRGRNLSLDMTRGKPSPEQLDLCEDMLTAVGPGEAVDEDGTDLRNYGGLLGIPEARRLFAEYLDVKPHNVIVCGNSSLSVMWDVLSNAMMFGMPGGDGPWKDQSPKVICPVPGYDRHFAICERLGIEMVTVDMTPDGPDMDAVTALAAHDESVKAIWCVPKYSNPGGEIYSDDVVRALASMETAAADFRLLWDNAYQVHRFDGEPVALLNVLDECERAGNPDRAIIFGSTSKVSLAGGGVAMFASSATNLKDHSEKISYQTIGPDKINQLRQVKFFKDMAGVYAHMERHAEIVRPKFQAVNEALERELDGSGLATWTKPNGGYFVSVDVLDGCATEIIRRCGDAGVKITPAGATFPYGNDPRDRNIRIAPTLPNVEEISRAMAVLTAAIKLVCLEKLTQQA